MAQRHLHECPFCLGELVRNAETWTCRACGQVIPIKRHGYKTLMGTADDSMAFPGGYVEQLNISHDLIDVTTFGAAGRQVIRGPARIEMRLILQTTDTIAAVLRALGATAEEAEKQAEAAVEQKLGRRRIKETA